MGKSNSSERQAIQHSNASDENIYDVWFHKKHVKTLAVIGIVNMIRMQVDCML